MCCTYYTKYVAKVCGSVLKLGAGTHASRFDPSMAPVTRPRAEELVRTALELEPENEEAKSLLREFLGDENCRRKELRLQVHMYDDACTTNSALGDCFTPCHL